MAKTALAVLLAALAIGAVWFGWNWRVEREVRDGQTVAWHIVPRTSETPAAPAAVWGAPSVPARSPTPTFRMAGFCVDGLDDAKLSHPRMSEVLLQTVPQFELIALIGFPAPIRGEPARIVDAVNSAAGKHYAWIAGGEPNHSNHRILSAVLYDQTAIEVDPATVHWVNDPAGAFVCPPLVAQFRVRGPPPEQAFTFRLIVVRVDPRRADEEMSLLAQVFRTVRDEPHGEDDIILLGALETDETRLGELGRLPDLTAALFGAPSTVRGTRRADNILFQRRVTSEFNHRAEVFDVMRHCRITVDQAAELFEHLPFWAEFKSFEDRSAR